MLLTPLETAFTNRGADFSLALHYYQDYPGLYCLIEVEKKDWRFLPPSAGILTKRQRESLKNLSYITSSLLPSFCERPKVIWSATDSVKGMDGKERRWIYLHTPQGNPFLNFLDPSFAANRLIAGKILFCLHQLPISLFKLSPSPFPKNGGGNLAESIRKWGGFSMQTLASPLSLWRYFFEEGSDFFEDTLLRSAFLHALKHQNGEFLSFAYELLDAHQIPFNRLVHTEKLAYDFSALEGEEVFFFYQGAKISGEEWIKKVQKEQVSSLHPEEKLLFTAFRALQPGIFTFSNQETCLKKNAFLNALKDILKIRKLYHFRDAKLLGVIPTEKEGLLLLLYELPGTFYKTLTAFNLTQKKIEEKIRLPEAVNTSLINLMTRKSLSKELTSDLFTVELEPLNYQIILLQPLLSSY